MILIFVGILVFGSLLVAIVRWSRRPWPRVGHGDAYFRSTAIQGTGEGYFQTAEVRTSAGS
jgi:hypothetical protein